MINKIAMNVKCVLAGVMMLVGCLAQSQSMDSSSFIIGQITKAALMYDTLDHCHDICSEILTLSLPSSDIRTNGYSSCRNQCNGKFK